MKSATPAIRELARRLIAVEASRAAMAAAGGDDAARACEKLRAPLAKLAGPAGYRSLISRAMAIAKAESPVLDSVQVRADGSLEGLAVIAEKDGAAGAAVLVQLLSLLVTFIGESLTIVLVRDAWPDEPIDMTALRAETQP